MAKDEESWKRRREREDEAEAAELEQKEKSKIGVSKPSPTGPSENKLIELMDRAEPMIEQLNTLYNMFIAGAEKIPPVERRGQLDHIMRALQAMSKPTLGVRFRYNALQSKYTVHCDRWDKMMKSLEKGGRKRPLAA